MRTASALWHLSIAICCCVSAAPAIPQDARQDGTTSIPAQADYLDNEDRRRLADIRFEPDESFPGAIRIGISAIGADVNPIPGYRGVRGANRYTAEELELVLSGDRELLVITKYDDGRMVTSNRVRATRIQTVPERRLMPNGRIDFLARTIRRYPVELTASTAADEPGRRTTELLVDGEARFQLTYDLADGIPLITDVRSLGHDQYGPPEINQQGRQVQFAAVPPDEYPEKPPVEIADWDQRDLEGKWVAYINDIAAHPEHQQGWIDFLAGQNDVELLEWIAIYQPDAFKSHGVGEVLVRIQAPNWLRVAVWHVSAPATFGHGVQLANTIVLYTDPSVALDWMRKHREDIDNWDDGVESYQRHFRASDVEAKDSSHLSPPLRTAEVLRFLNAPETVREFGDRVAAEPNVVYVHQVVRAIDGAVVAGRYDKSTIGKVRELVGHSNATIRQHALLAFSYLAPAVSRSDRFDDLVAIINNPDESPAIRESAVMGYAYHNHPQVILTLHDIAANPSHPGWSAAVSRLGDLGIVPSQTLLEGLPQDDLSDEQRAVLEQALQRFAESAERREEAMLGMQVSDVYRLIELAAWAEVTSDRRAEFLRVQAISAGRQLEGDNRDVLASWHAVPSESGIWLPGSQEQYNEAFNGIRNEALQRK